MPTIQQRTRYWLEDHDVFEDLSIRFARRRLRAESAGYRGDRRRPGTSVAARESRQIAWNLGQELILRKRKLST